MSEIENVDLETTEKIETGTESDDKDSKPKLTPEQELGIKKRQFNKLAKELGIDIEKPAEHKKQESGYERRLIEKSFLNSKGIPEEDHQWILDEAKSTGKDIDILYGFKYVQEELKNRKDQRASETATSAPSGSKRAGSAAKDSAEHWFAKIERGDATLGQIPDVKLRHEVRKMKEKKYGGDAGDTITFGASPRK